MDTLPLIDNRPIRARHDQKETALAPQTGVLEAKYAEITGELVKFSEGYLVDCQYPYSGCAGGHAADGWYF